MNISLGIHCLRTSYIHLVALSAFRLFVDNELLNKMHGEINTKYFFTGLSFFA
jgi:hypothetical protein